MSTLLEVVRNIFYAVRQAVIRSRDFLLLLLLLLTAQGLVMETTNSLHISGLYTLTPKPIENSRDLVNSAGKVDDKLSGYVKDESTVISWILFRYGNCEWICIMMSILVLTCETVQHSLIESKVAIVD